ncbi:MAG: bifunctional diguanylate cyclase/phosphodiesterase [Candidatus Binatia bacterium]|nr:bifunctional diguanylate cyclase/phosphodiesterase [Candidatus Binatia bacterium]
MSESSLETVRMQVVDRLATLLESQTFTKTFGCGVVELIRSMHRDIVQELWGATEAKNDLTAKQAITGAIEICERLDRSLTLLFNQRDRQWQRNRSYVRSLLGEFNETLTTLADTLVEKDLFERQSLVLERIILSHENVTQWKEFVQEILADFHAIFPFNFFYIAFAEEHELSLFLYYLGSYSEEIKSVARESLSQQVMANLGLPSDAPIHFEEFAVKDGGQVDAIGTIRMITVAVPEHTPKLAGLLGVAYAASRELSPQEESVVRSILSVMVMVVGSSKALSRTLAELEYYSMHDPLTGLYNRRHFNAMLDYEVGRSERHGHEFALLLFDLDNFKDINDSYGHPIGDATLCGVAEVLQSRVRKGDLAVRLGGDEFALILMEIGRGGAITVANDLGHALRERIFEGPNGNGFHLTISIGVVVFPHDAANVTDLLASGDMAMYCAKDKGKDSTCTLDDVERKGNTGHSKLDYVEKLRDALHQDRIVPYYHSIVDCHTGQVFAYEALARLMEASGEVVPAGVFIDAVEKHGLGRELDRAIIYKAFHAKRDALLSESTAAKLFINLSAKEIQSRGILGYAEELCTSLEIPPEYIVFEILERDAIGDITNMRKFLSNLRAKGFAFALDDFGSGYNSFHYLRELRFEYVKIDGAFIRNIINSQVDYTLVHNLSRLCHDLGIRTIAEFVENQAILDALRTMDINYVQGFHISMPTNEMR